MMYPTNQYMDPYYSHYKNHTPYSYYPPPGWEAGHPRAMDSSFRPPSYGPWPYHADMHHPHRPEFHCCCNHSYPAGYYGFRPPYPQELPPAHLYYHGPFPQLPNEYPSYFARPHPYRVEQTPYDYNKSKNHCCGCPNHVCHGGEKSNVKIEEERPKRELKGADNSSIIRHPNNQYPVIWLPSGNIEDKENGKRYELPPQLLNGWIPVGSKRTEDEKQQGQDGQKEKQYQWPVVWMPAGYEEPKQKAIELKEKDDKPKITEETPPSPKIKIIPVSWFEDQKPAAKGGSRDHSDRSVVESEPATTEHLDEAAMEGHHKTAPVVPRRVNDERNPARGNYKTIPVLPEKVTDEKKLGTCRTIPVTSEKESDEKKPTVTEKKEEKNGSNAERPGENGKGNHSETPTAKHSKLPPVCLRVDPFPRKKSGNASSRSPSPPTRKDADKAKKDTNKTQSENLEPKQTDTKKHATVSEMKENSPEELKKGTGFCNETVLANSARHSREEEVPTSDDHQKVQATSSSVCAQENAGAVVVGDGTQGNGGAETLKEGEKSTDRHSETFRANLSESDAVVRIQSAYRGYDVRRWQPLDKLRKIRDVHEQMEGVRKQLQSFEASSEKPTEKEQMAIGEAVMNLLLKLDTMQGLHPCVREARKSVARELICLQEKLDALCKQPAGGLNHTNKDERLDRADSIIHNAAPTLTAQASDKEEKSVELSEANETSLVNSMELGDAVPSEVNMTVEPSADPSELKKHNEKSCTSTMEVLHEEGKAAEQVEFQGTSTTDMMNAVALSEHPHDNNERQIDESSAGLLEVNEEEKKVAVADEGQDMPLMDSMGPSHDAAPTVDSSGQEKCLASNAQSLLAEESNTGVSPAVSGDIEATTTVESLDNGRAADSAVSAEDQTREAVGVESPELRHDVSPTEETPVILEDPLVSLKDAEPHKHDSTTAVGSVTSNPTITAADSVTSNVDEQPEEDRNMSMQEQDSTKKPDGTSQASMGSTSEGPAQAALLVPTSEFESVSEQAVLEELNNEMRSDLSGKDDAPHVDQKNEELTGEFDAQENHSIAEGSDSRAEAVFQELASFKSSAGYEGAHMTVPVKSQTAEQNEGVQNSCPDARTPNIDERTETPKDAPAGVMGPKSVEVVDVHVSQTEECNGTLGDSTICTTEVTSSEVESNDDVSMQTENKATEALSATITTDNAKDSDDKKLAEENQKLRALLQKFLASGNDQMEVITDLSEKVKVLERKLARKKKPRVRVRRPAGHGTARVH